MKEVQKIYQFNIQETLTNQQALALLKTFLEQYRGGNESIPYQCIAVYKQCGEYTGRSYKSLLTLDELEKLKNLGLPRHLESELLTQIQTGDYDNITHCLMRIQGEMCNNIELSIEYKDYKNAISKKLHQ